MPRDFHVEELMAQRTRAHATDRRFIGPDPTAGLAPNCGDWCKAIDSEPRPARDAGLSYRRQVRWTPERDDLLGWATLLMTAPGILIGLLLALAWLGA